MFVYKPGRDEDLRMLQWYLQMEEAGDIERLFLPNDRTPSALLNLLAPPKFMFYDLDEAGAIRFAMWGEGLMSGVVIGLWLAPAWRGQMASLKSVLAGYETILKHVPVVMGVTRQPDLLKTHAKLGYTIHGPIPHLYDGEPGWLVVLTREAFTAAMPRYRRRAKSVEV